MSAVPAADQARQRLVAEFEQRKATLVGAEARINQSIQIIHNFLKTATSSQRPAWEATLATTSKQLIEAQNAT
jgi:hypothetical protein